MIHFVKDDKMFEVSRNWMSLLFNIIYLMI